MAQYDPEMLTAAHRHCSDNREAVKASRLCGCFYCRRTFSAGEIANWVHSKPAALCPKCGIDSVLPDRSGLPVTDTSFLQAMHERWFERGRATDGEETIELYRPVGPSELALIEQAGFSAFPPRLPEQPIFYPVTNEAYAIRIARGWNTKVGSKEGFVTQFAIRKSFLARYERKIVGGREHEEYWIPAEDLQEFNANIVGRIAVVRRFTEADRIAAEKDKIVDA
jgi:hypothetical protein